MNAITNSDDTESVTARLRTMREIEADADAVTDGDLLFAIFSKVPREHHADVTKAIVTLCVRSFNNGMKAGAL